MAKYTTQIKSLVEADYPLFDFEYPIFDTNYKSVLEQKIIDRYYFREIGLETAGQFKHFLKMKLNEIMPYYNKLYSTEGLITNENFMINLDNHITQRRTTDQVTSGKGLSNVKSVGEVKSVGVGSSIDDNTSTNTSTSEGTITSETDGTSRVESDGTVSDTSTTKNDSKTTGENASTEIFSDTPQAKLSGLDYATNMTDRDGTDSATTNGTGSSTSNGESNNVTTGTSNDSTTSTSDDVTTGSNTSKSIGSNEATNNTNSEDVTAGTNETNGTAKTIDEYTEHLLGNGSMRYSADILAEWRKHMLNIDVMVLDELNDLFMNIY